MFVAQPLRSKHLRATRRGAALSALLVAAAAAPPASAAVFVGTPGADVLIGKNPAGNLIVGGGGPDILIGGPGPDEIYGVRSGNSIDAGEGDNYVEGGTGDDRIIAGNGRNTVYGGTGHDTIRLGHGNNYVDPGGAPDVVRLGNGDNVVNGGSGGLDLVAGDGNNTVYLSSSDTVVLGTGVNTVYIARPQLVKRVSCGGHPQSRVLVSDRYDPDLSATRRAVSSGRIHGCATAALFSGTALVGLQMARSWEVFDLVGSEGPDRLFGGHGGGRIDGRGGDNIIWADYHQQTGGAEARSRTTRISAADGNNTVFGGRGTNIIRLGNGRNFVRGGAWNNDISVGSGHNVVRLQGRGTNRLTFRGGTGYVESYANGPKPRIRCKAGADVAIVHGNTRPITNCATVESARTRPGRILQVRGLVRIADSPPVKLPAPVPGELAGVPRPN